MTMVAQQPTGQTCEGLFIRRAAAADAEALQCLYYDYLGTHEEYELDSIRDSMEADNIYVAVTDEGQITGTLTSARVFDYIDQDGNREKGMVLIGGWHSLTIGDELICFDNGVTHEIRGVCVDTAYRNQGVAAALLEHALSEIQTRSYAFV